MKSLLLASLLLAGAASAQDTAAPTTTLRVEARLVNLFVNVTDAHGAPVPDLLKANFGITEDGVPQILSVFEKQTNVPLSVVLAIDTSGSTRKDTSLEQHAAHDFAQALLGKTSARAQTNAPRAASSIAGEPAQGEGKPGDPDQLALFSFSSDVREIVPFTDNVHRVDSGLHDLGQGPATAFYAAVLLAAQSLAPHGGRKVLVVVSDGGNTVAGTSFDEALAEAQRDDVRIYSLIDTPIEADAGRDIAGEHAMITLSQETGGRAIYVDRNGLPAALRKVIDDLRTQYLLAYSPQHGGKPQLGGPGGLRSVHVTLQNTPKDDVPHYRTGYYRPQAAP